jgi:cytochrome P450
MVPTLPGLTLATRKLIELPSFLVKIRDEHGPVVNFRSFRTNVFFLTEPSLVEEVLVTKGAAFKKGRGTDRLSLLLGRGLLTSEPPQHLRHRRLIQPAFHRKRIEGYAQIVVDETARRVAAWREGETLDIDGESNRLALDIVSKALFGSDLSGDVDAIGFSLGAAIQAFPKIVAPLAELVDWLPLPSRVKLGRARRRLDEVVYRMIREHRAGGGDPNDLLSMLLETQDEGGAGLTDAQIRDEALTILVAGHETTANAIAWAFYLLQRHPEVEHRLHEHLAAVLGERTAVAADVPSLDYARAVFAETMRLYPPAWITGRFALEAVDIGPLHLNRGDIVLVSQYVSHRDARYFPDPERFAPERWTAGTPPPKFAYFPFGGGRRLCIGEPFAWMEGILAIATIAQRVSLRLVDEADVEPEALVTLRPRGAIRARVERRDATWVVPEPLAGTRAG